MKSAFSYTLLQNWLKAGKDLDRGALAGLLPHQRLLLLSDGSLTLELELLYGGRVEVEVRFKGTSRIGNDAAAYLEEEPFKEAIEREVWLTVGGKRLVYAHSLIPLACVQNGLLEDLERNSSEPLGRVLSSRKIFFAKNNLEVGSVRCALASLELGIAEETPLMARRYILFNREDAGTWVIKAAVTEIFSPAVISSPLAVKN